jgi:hypothetical protein
MDIKQVEGNRMRVSVRGQNGGWLPMPEAGTCNAGIACERVIDSSAAQSNGASRSRIHYCWSGKDREAAQLTPVRPKVAQLLKTP